MTRLARAFKVRIKSILDWDYWEEFVPALKEIAEVPTVDEAFFHAFCKPGKSKQDVGTPLNTKEARLKAFESLKQTSKEGC